MIMRLCNPNWLLAILNLVTMQQEWFLLSQETAWHKIFIMTAYITGMNIPYINKLSMTT